MLCTDAGTVEQKVTTGDHPYRLIWHTYILLTYISDMHMKWTVISTEAQQAHVHATPPPGLHNYALHISFGHANSHEMCCFL